MFDEKNGHETVLSMGSSVYDECCINCGATDARNDDRLSKPCPKPKNPQEHGGGTSENP